MKAFAFHSPKTIDQALDSLADAWGRVDLLAGGTDLVNLLKEGIAEPNLVVNLADIDDLKGIDVESHSIRIGASVTLAELAAHSAVRKHLPALAQAADVIGGPQIRNMGTVGGNLCQRTRDWYFRNRIDDADPQETQYSAIFPLDGRRFVAPSTLAPPLIAHGATVSILSKEGERSIPVERFFQISNLKDVRETVLKPNEIVSSIRVPVDPAVRGANHEIRERESHDWPLVQASVAVLLRGTRVDAVSIILGHVAATPIRARLAEAALLGTEWSDEIAGKAGALAVQNAQPTPKNAYKVTLARVAVKRALLAAVGNEYWRNHA